MHICGVFLAVVVVVAKLPIRELLRYKTKIYTCHHMLTTFRQLQNRSFHTIERKRTSAKCRGMKNARAKSAKLLFFVVKYSNL